VWEGLAPLQEGPSGGEPPEKERRRLKESFENYRRWAGGQAGRRGGLRAARPTCPRPAASHRKRALRKMQNGWRQGEGDRGNTTGSDNTDTEGA
jgi:caspase recruitment domain-containing protein 9